MLLALLNVGNVIEVRFLNIWWLSFTSASCTVPGISLHHCITQRHYWHRRHYMCVMTFHWQRHLTR